MTDEIVGGKISRHELAGRRFGPLKVIGRWGLQSSNMAWTYYCTQCGHVGKRLGAVLVRQAETTRCPSCHRNKVRRPFKILDQDKLEVLLETAPPRGKSAEVKVKRPPPTLEKTILACTDEELDDLSKKIAAEQDRRNEDSYYECSTCGESVYMGDLGAVMFHEHKGLTETHDFSAFKPGVRVRVEKKDTGDSSRQTVDKMAEALRLGDSQRLVMDCMGIMAKLDDQADRIDRSVLILQHAFAESKELEDSQYTVLVESLCMRIKNRVEEALDALRG